MSVFSGFTRRNNLIKTLQFKLTPMYGTAEKMEKLGVLASDKERSRCRKILLDVLRRVDATFIDNALCAANSLDWQPLAETLSDGKKERIARQQAVMRKAVAKLLTKHGDYKNLVNPTKAIKLAAAATENAAEADAVTKYARFTTVLVDYFNLKKVFFSSEEKQTTIAYRIAHVNFSLYWQNLSLLEKYRDAGLDFQDKFSFPYTEINSYNRCLVQSQIDAYNRAVGKINIELYSLYRQRKLPQALKGVAVKLQMLHKQVMSGGSDKKVPFDLYTEMQNAVISLKNSLTEIFSLLDEAFSAELELADTYQRLRQEISDSADNLLFREHDEQSIVSLKRFLTAVLALRRFSKKTLRGYEQECAGDQEEIFLACSNAWSLLEEVPQLYAKVHSYLTRKPYKIDKIRCYFDCAAFGKGWDVNKESAYLLTLFRREERFYLGIRRQGAKINFADMPTNTTEICYEKMVYKSFDFVKGFPGVVFAKSVLQKFVEGAERVVLDGDLYSCPLVVIREDFEQKYFVENGTLHEREAGAIKYLKEYYAQSGDLAGYRQAVRQRIELAKRFIAAYTTFDFFDMSQLKPASAYESWTDFLVHVNKFTYGLRWQRVPIAVIEKLVAAGDLFFFRLDNQDFALAGNENRAEDEQTLFLREIFSERNARERVLKLLGDVEVYYRPASLPAEVTHRKGSVLVNKKDVHNNLLPRYLHQNICQYLNGAGEELLPEAAELLDKGMVKWKRAAEDIIKDKRFTEAQLSVHFPVSINYRCPNKDYGLNRDFRSLLQNNTAVNIMGVHLGGQNLAEAVIIDQKGQILLRKEFNEFNQYNFYQALVLKEEERRQAQQNWLQMEKIKNIRSGFLSALVSEVSKLALAYNAVIVLENFGNSKRKNTGAALTHMQFATSLLHKLNYLVLKQQAPLAPGGILNGYQLAPKAESLAGFANQIGCVFLVLPDYDGGEDEKAAYNLALKGLLLLRRIHEAENVDKVDLLITKKNWLEFLREYGSRS